MSELIKCIFDIKRSKPYNDYNKYHINNIFGITKTARSEKMHSNFIAWVLNPNSSHSLYYYPLFQFTRALNFIKEKTDNEQARLDSKLIYKFYDDDFITHASVEREKDRIDILIEITTKDNKILPILIENKVDSPENGQKNNQTEDYFKYGELKYNNRDKYYEPIYIFLLPEYKLKMQQKEKSYIRMTYQELVDYIIEPSMLKCNNLESINNFKTYLQCLSFQADYEKGASDTMAISSEEKKILDDFIKENKPLLVSILNSSSLKEELDNPNIINELIKTLKDRSTYQFNGKEYPVKRKLALDIIKQYVEDYNPQNFAELESKFPHKIQGTGKGVLKLYDKISDKDKGIGGSKRYFVDSDEIINLQSGEQVVVSNQWSIDTITELINHVKQFGYTITKL